MTQQIKPSVGGLTPEEKRRLYEAAFRRARQVLEAPMVQWLTPDPNDWSLGAVLQDCEARMAGCSREEAHEGLELAIALMRCARPNDMVWSGYLNIMMMFPRELLMPSIKTAIAAERYHVLPTVGALVAYARAESELRQGKIGMLKRAIGRLELRAFYETQQGDRSRAARLRGSTVRTRPD
jgi:hypothetical protein